MRRCYLISTLLLNIFATHIWGEQLYISTKSSLHSNKKDVLYSNININLYNISSRLLFTETQINPQIEGEFIYKYASIQCGHRQKTFQSGLILSNRSFYLNYSPKVDTVIPFGCSIFSKLPYFNTGILYYQYLPKLLYKKNNNNELQKLSQTLFLSNSFNYSIAFLQIKISTLYDITSLFNLVFYQKKTPFEWKKITYSGEFTIKHHSFNITSKNYVSIHHGTFFSGKFILKKPLLIHVFFHTLFSKKASPFSNQIFDTYKEQQSIYLRIENYFIKLKRYKKKDETETKYNFTTFMVNDYLRIQYRYTQNEHQTYMQSSINISKYLNLITGLGIQWTTPVLECILGIEGNILNIETSNKTLSWRILLFGVWYTKDTSIYIPNFERLFILERKSEYEYMSVQNTSIGISVSILWKNLSIESHAQFQAKNIKENIHNKQLFSFHTYIQYQQKFQI